MTKKLIFGAIIGGLLVSGGLAVVTHKASASNYGYYYNNDCGCETPPPQPYVYTPPVAIIPPPAIIQPVPYYAPLQVTCQANPVRAAIGSTITWTASIFGGNTSYNGYNTYYNNNYYNNGGYSISWTGTDGLAANSSTVISKTYITPGQKVATVTVYQNGQSVTASCASFIGVAAPVVYSTTAPTAPQRVYLNQVPYTGAGSVTKVGLFLAILIAWSAMVAWIIMKRRAGRLAVAGISSTIAPLPETNSSGNFLSDYVNQLRQQNTRE